MMRMVRPRASTWLALSTLVLGLAALPAQARSVVQVGTTVADLDASIRFYTEVLPFRVVERIEREGPAEERLQAVFGLRTLGAVLALGDERLELTEYLTPRGRPVPGDSRSNDRWFQHVAIVVRDMDRAYARLAEHRVRHASPRPQTLPAWNPSAGGIRAFYFADPDGHVLELLQFPPGKGDARWHRDGDDLFLGIDHTAIVVDDTERSLAFWRDTLGLRVAGTSDNHGDEQERLNNVFGAHLRITTLRADTGPGVELLEYRTPRSGRPMPTDTAANDLWHWTTTVRVDGLAGLAADLARRGAAVSPRPVARDAHATHPMLLVRDPDGHRALLLGDAPGAAPKERAERP